MLEFIKQPWPWYISGPLIGLTVPALLILGNKSFGVSAALRDVCACCMPAGLPFFTYDWKKQSWNLFFVAGIFLGAVIAAGLLAGPQGVDINPLLTGQLRSYGITDYHHLVPEALMNWHSLLTVRGFLIMVVGGFLVGFGSRYAGGCTSGHAIMGLATLQWPSLVATVCFMIGGFTMANLLLPIILSL